MDPEATDAVRHEWGLRVAAEYTSAAITQELTLWLIQIGASPDLIDLGLSVVRDELDHARESHEICRLAGVSSLEPVSREQLSLPRDHAAPLEHDVVRSCVRSFCIGETLAVPLFSAMRAHARVGPVRVLLDRIVRDEVRHRDFGWLLLEWMVERSPALVTEAAEVAAEELPGRHARAVEMASLPPAGDAERAWGLLEGERYGPAVARAIERDIRPRFARLGVRTD